MPLILKRVWIGGVRLGDASYQQRPRLKPDKDYSDLQFGTHELKGDLEVFREAEISGSFGFSPFVPRENRGIKLLKFLSMDADLVIDVNSLEFLNPFTQGFNAMSIDGNGAVDGHLNMKTRRVR